MRIRNISNQGVILRKTNAAGEVLDTVRVQPGDVDVHESWIDEVKAHPLLTDDASGPYEGPARKGLVEPQAGPTPGSPASAVKHDDMPHGGHPGRPSGPEDETARVDVPPDLTEDEKRKADEAAKRKADEKGPGTRRRDG